MNKFKGTLNYANKGDGRDSSNASNDAPGTPLKLRRLILVLSLDLVMHTFMERMVSAVAVLALVVFFLYITRDLLILSIKIMPWKYSNL